MGASPGSVGEKLAKCLFWQPGRRTAVCTFNVAFRRVYDRNGQWGLNVLQTADHKVHHTFIEAVCLGIPANLMVCLAVWMSYSGRSLMDKAFIMVLPVAMFVASGFEHSIANMFMIPMGIVIRDFASPEFWTAVGSAPENFFT